MQLATPLKQTPCGERWTGIPCPRLFDGCWVSTQAWLRSGPGCCERPGRAQRRLVVLPERGVDEDAGGDVRAEGHHDRGHGAPPDDSDCERQPEREQRVAEGDRALGVERRRRPSARSDGRAGCATT